MLHPVTRELARVGLGSRRRVWAGDGHAHIEVEAIAEPQAAELRARLKQSLERLDAVQWAEVNALTRRVAVSFEERLIDVAGLLGVVDSVERDHSPRTLSDPDEPPHPADSEPLLRAVTVLLGDVGGLVLSSIAAVMPLPLELALLVSLLDSQPRLRRMIQQRLGPRATELGLPLLAALAEGLAQGPSGPLVDLLYRSMLVGEIQARRQAWAKREPHFYANPRRKPVEPPELEPRPVPLPGGPVGTWADRLSIAALVGFTATLATTGNAQRAVDAFLAGTPKAARLGREGFATQLGRILCARGVVPLQAKALRRLDRLDTVVLDITALVTGQWQVAEVVPVGERSPAELRQRVATLWDPRRPDDIVTDDRWRLAPLAKQAVPEPLRPLRKDGALVLGLWRDHQLNGYASAVAELDPAATMLAETVRRAGHRLIIAGRKGAVGRQLGADGVCPRGERLGAAVRDLQREGAVIAVVTRRGRAGLVAADVGIGVLRRSGRPPWGADLLCGPQLDDATFIIGASVAARAVSRRSARLALAGSGLGAVAALAGPPVGAMQRGMLVVNGSAALALAAGALSARGLDRGLDRLQPHALPRMLVEVGRAAPGLVVRTVSRGVAAALCLGSCALRLGGQAAGAVARVTVASRT